jgi:hypothetical protein
MPVTGASIGNHIAENRESVQRDRPLPSSVGASSIIKIESEPLLDAYSQSCAWVAPLNRGSLNSAHIHGTHVPVEEPSTASVSDSCTAANSNAIRSSRQRAAEVAGAREAERLGGLEWDSLVGKAARSRESVMLTVSILRRRQCAAVVDTPSDGVHAGLARSAFEAVSATNSFQ